MVGVKVMEKGFYHDDMGYWQTNSTPNEETLASYPEGTVEVPLPQSQLDTFDSSTLSWIPPTQEMLDEHKSNMVRFERNMLLAAVDALSMHTVRWEGLTEEKKSEWKQYRSELLDITDQAGFPYNVTWPTKPE
jgi:hypothetical protein